MSTALPLQEQYDTYVTLVQFEVDFKQHYDLITMMVFILLHFVFLLCYISFLMRHRTCVLAIDFG